MGDFLQLGFVILWLGVVIYVITLAARFVGAHERMASALEKIALKPRDDGRP